MKLKNRDSENNVVLLFYCSKVSYFNQRSNTVNPLESLKKNYPFFLTKDKNSYQLVVFDTYFQAPIATKIHTEMLDSNNKLREVRVQKKVRSDCGD